MAITVSGLRDMSPTNLEWAGWEFSYSSVNYSTSEDTFLSEVSNKVYSPDVWDGGGQSDATVVMDINLAALAVGRLEMDAAHNALAALAAALTTAQTALKASLADAASSNISVAEDGTAQFHRDLTNALDDDETFKAIGIQADVKGQLLFASLADASCKGLLDLIANQHPRSSSTADLGVLQHNSELLDQATELNGLSRDNKTFWEAATPEPLPPELPHDLSDLAEGAGELFAQLWDDPGKAGELLLDGGVVAAGVLLALLGAGGEVGGITVSATGVGAVVGVPAAIASAGVVASGLALVGAGAYELGNDLNELSRSGKDSGGGGGEEPPRYKPGSNRDRSRSYANSVSDAKGQANRYADKMRQKGYEVKVPRVREDKYGGADVTVTVYKNTPTGQKIVHIRHFIVK